MLSGLTPDTAYCYRILGGSTDLLGTDAIPDVPLPGAGRLEDPLFVRRVR